MDSSDFEQEVFPSYYYDGPGSSLDGPSPPLSPIMPISSSDVSSVEGDAKPEQRETRGTHDISSSDVSWVEEDERPGPLFQPEQCETHATHDISFSVNEVSSVEEDERPGPSDQRQTKRATKRKAGVEEATEKMDEEPARKIKRKKDGKSKKKTGKAKTKGGKGKQKKDGKAKQKQDGKAKLKRGGKAKQKTDKKSKGKKGGTTKDKKARKAKARSRFTKHGVTGRHVASHIAERREERLDELREIINGMDFEALRTMLLHVVERESGLLFDLMQAPPVEDLPPSTELGWCTCGNCKPMPRDVEALCCGMEPENCLSRSQYVLSMMDPFFNALQRRMWVNLENREGDDQGPGAEHTRTRWQVYRSFVLWQHGRLGIGNRVVVPSCVVCRTRNEYPDPYDHYTGFIAANL